MGASSQSRARALLATAVFLALSAAAAAGVAEAGPGKRVVLVASRVDATFGEDLARTLRAQLSDVQVVLDVAWVDAPAGTIAEQIASYKPLSGDGAVATCWLAPVQQEEIALFIADGPWKRILVRRVGPEDGGGRVEAVALIARSAVEILLEGGTIGVAAPPPVAVPEPAPLPAALPLAPEEPAPERPLVGLDVGYAFAVRSAESPAVHGVRIDAAVSPLRHLFLAVGYTVWLPIELRAEAVAVDVYRHPLHLGAAVEWEAGPLLIGPRASVIFDYVMQEASLPRDAPDATARRNQDLLVSAEPLLEVRCPLGAGLSLVLSAGVEINFNRVRYVFDAADGEKTVEEPFVVQPRANLALSFLAG
ncbi:MAG: hypothetical protein PHU25_10225 [Deltaproteobacteria bacterium]|nr:hypothetical protein [Deltaproteobacteria bacterium]